MHNSLISAAIILGASVFLASCGEDPVYIADKVRFKIYFKERIAEVDFELNSDYQTSSSAEEAFGGLAHIELRKEDHQVLSILSLIDPEILARDWPLQIRNSLPGEKSLPSPHHKSWIYEWQGSQLSYLLDEHRGLSLGALYQNEDFQKLPEGFLATQKIYAKDKSLKANVAIFGPSSSSPGGLFLMGYLGSNPFEGMDPSNAELYSEVEFQATEPTQILSLGKYTLNHMWSLKTLGFR